MVHERPDNVPANGPRDDPENTLRGRDLVGLGGLLAGSVVAFTVLGILVDSQAGTSPAFTMAGVGLGIVLGGVGFWLRVRAALRG